MARGSKSKYTSKQKRQAKHIEDQEEKSGKSEKRAAQIAWATVNKETGGAGKKVSNTSPSKRGGKKGGKARKKTTKKTTKKSAKKTSKKTTRKAGKKTGRKKSTKKSRSK